MGRAHSPLQERLYQLELATVTTKSSRTVDSNGCIIYKVLERKTLDRTPRPPVKRNNKWRKR